MALYNDMRPTTFDEVFGQDEAVKILKAVLEQDEAKRPRVFLLTGNYAARQRLHLFLLVPLASQSVWTFKFLMLRVTVALIASALSLKCGEPIQCRVKRRGVSMSLTSAIR